MSKTIKLPENEILCWSDLKNDYAPTAHPKFASPREARDYGNTHIKHTDFVVRPVSAK